MLASFSRDVAILTLQCSAIGVVVVLIGMLLCSQHLRVVRLREQQDSGHGIKHWTMQTALDAMPWHAAFSWEVICSTSAQAWPKTSNACTAHIRSVLQSVLQPGLSIPVVYASTRAEAAVTARRCQHTHLRGVALMLLHGLHAVRQHGRVVVVSRACHVARQQLVVLQLPAQLLACTSLWVHAKHTVWKAGGADGASFPKLLSSQKP